MKVDLYELQANLSPLQTLNMKENGNRKTAKDRRMAHLNDVRIVTPLGIEEKPVRHKCFADKCKKLSRQFGYCADHFEKVQCGMDIDDIPFPSGWFRRWGVK